jgi:omega-6 fatty acid desaturase (delta-12 desaturase)
MTQHAKHHAANGHMTRDQVWLPKTRSQLGIASEEEVSAKKASSTFDKVDDLLEDAPLYLFAFLVIQQLFGWPSTLRLLCESKHLTMRQCT